MMESASTDSTAARTMLLLPNRDTVDTGTGTLMPGMPHGDREVASMAARH